MFDTPILYLIFNRFQETKITFSSICNIKPKRLFIAADGPRIGNFNDEINCNLVREYVISMIDWDCDVQTLFREENLGCGKAVSSAISWFFTNVDEGIILEDDCLPNISFFKFCSELLEKYRFDLDVMSISGSYLLKNIKVEKKNSYLWGVGGIWGWATWKRAWELYDYDMIKIDLLNKEYINKYFSHDYWTKYYFSFFNDVVIGKIDTWDIQWIYSIILNNGLCISPNINLVENIGFGPSATHTKDPNNYVNNIKSKELTFPLKHPVEKKINIIYLNELYKQFNPSMKIYLKLIYRIKNFFK